MKRVLPLFFIIILCSSFTFLNTDLANEIEQAIDIEFGEEYKLTKSTTLKKIITTTDDGFYTLRVQQNLAAAMYGLYGVAKKYYIEFYTNDMVKTKSAEIDPRYLKKKMGMIYFYINNDKIYAFLTAENKKAKLKTLFYQEVDKRSCRLKGGLRKVAEYSYAGRGLWSGKGHWEFDLSPDSSKLLIYHSLPYKRKESEKYGLYVVDNRLKSVWKKDVELPYTDQEYLVNGIQVDNDGNAYVVGSLTEKVDVIGLVDIRLPTQINMIAYTEKGRKSEKFDIELEDGYVRDYTIKVNPETGELVCAGFYGDEKLKSSIDGVFYMRVDKEDMDVMSESYKELGLEFFATVATEEQLEKMEKKEEKGKDYDLHNYVFRNLVSKTDGGALLVAEQFYITERRTNRGTDYYYNYNSIVVISIDSEGEVEWAHMIPKYQRTKNDGGYKSGFALMVKDDRVHFIFNDHPKNLDWEPGDMIRPMPTLLKAKTTVTCVTLDSEAKFVRQGLFTKEDAEVFTLPQVCEQVTDDQMLLYGQRLFKHNFMRLTFK